MEAGNARIVHTATSLVDGESHRKDAFLAAAEIAESTPYGLPLSSSNSPGIEESEKEA
jgi:hypothetical protein